MKILYKKWSSPRKMPTNTVQSVKLILNCSIRQSLKCYAYWAQTANTRTV